MKNLFFELLDVEAIKKQIAKTPKDQCILLIGHYSINIQREYSDGETLDNHWNEFESALGHTMQVNDYDDLVIDPHGILND